MDERWVSRPHHRRGGSNDVVRACCITHRGWTARSGEGPLIGRYVSRTGTVKERRRALDKLARHLPHTAEQRQDSHERVPSRPLSGGLLSPMRGDNPVREGDGPALPGEANSAARSGNSSGLVCGGHSRVTYALG